MWKEIEGYERYLISDDGVVCSRWAGKERILKPHARDGESGYLQTCLCKNNTRYMPKIHRLVAQAFIPNPDNKPFVNHINGIKSDNRATNLEWVTRQENAQHAVRTKEWWGPSGEAHHFFKVTEKLANDVLQMLEKGMKQQDIAALVGVSQRTVGNIKRHETRVQRGAI